MMFDEKYQHVHTFFVSVVLLGLSKKAGSVYFPKLMKRKIAT